MCEKNIVICSPKKFKVFEVTVGMFLGYPENYIKVERYNFQLDVTIERVYRNVSRDTIVRFNKYVNKHMQNFDTFRLFNDAGYWFIPNYEYRRES